MTAIGLGFGSALGAKHQTSASTRYQGVTTPPWTEHRISEARYPRRRDRKSPKNIFSFCLLFLLPGPSFRGSFLFPPLFLCCRLRPRPSLDLATPERNSRYSMLSSSCQKVRLASGSHVVGYSSPLIRVAQHLTALRAWCKHCLHGR